MNRQGTQNLTLWIWSVVLVVCGILLLLHNYLLLEFNIGQLWPLLLAALGLQILVRGDLGISWAGQSFGITRGSVEAATLRASSGELDMRISVLQREGRLIAGQYTARSRPDLLADGNQAILTMQRGKTWLLSLADWELGLAADLPWNLLLSTYLGEIDADLRGLVIEKARISTGFGDIRVTAPGSPAGPIAIHSTLGDISLAVPPHMEAAVTVKGSPLFRIHAADNRWQQDEGQRYVTPGYHGAIDALEITVSGTFGDLTLA